MAQRGVNKVILIGRVGQDPEVRYLPNGGAVCNLTLATSESWRDKNTGENKEITEWHRVVIFGKLAEIAGEYVKKGSELYIEGQLRTRQWEKEGQKMYTTEVVVPQMGGTMQMIGGKKGDQSAPAQSGQPQQSGNANGQGGQQKRQQQRPAQKNSQPANNEPPMDFDDDIPF